MGMIKAFGGWLAAAVLLGITATVLSSVMVLAMLDEIGADIAAPGALSMIGDDLAGFGPLYTGLIAVALAIAFIAGALVTRLLPALRPVVFAVAGAAAMGVMLTLMEQVFFGVQMVAGARTGAGFLVQVLAGGAAGLFYAILTPAPKRR